MDNDFPAAHSMDTYWFAVDQDGHVAFFESGEAGAVPDTAFGGDEAYEVRRRLVRLLPRQDTIYDLRGRLMPGTEPGVCTNRGRGDQRWPMLMFLRSLAPVQEEIESGLATPVTASEGAAVVFQHLPEAVSHRLHDTGECRGCFYHHQESDDPDEGLPDLAARGIFEYGHLTDNWISGPYGRERRPGQPIHVDQLPPDMRAQFKEMTFSTLCFDSTPYIQPVEHTSCVSWEYAYMNVEATRIAPIEGREEEYAENFADLEDLGGEFEVEPPPGTQDNP
jgi:hypothetical protein